MIRLRETKGGKPRGTNGARRAPLRSQRLRLIRAFGAAGKCRSPALAALGVRSRAPCPQGCGPPWAEGDGIHAVPLDVRARDSLVGLLPMETRPGVAPPAGQEPGPWRIAPGDTPKMNQRCRSRRSPPPCPSAPPPASSLASSTSCSR